jgi:hypothetical protein
LTGTHRFGINYSTHQTKTSLNIPAVGSLELFSVLLSFFCTSVDLETLINVFLNPPVKYQKQGIYYCTTTIFETMKFEFLR